MAGLLDSRQRARPRPVGTGGVPPAAAARSTGRAAGGSLSSALLARRDDAPQPRRPLRTARGDDRRHGARVAVLRARVRAGRRERDRRARRSRAYAVARTRGDPGQRARAAIDGVPALGRHRSGGGRAPLRDPARARLRRGDHARIRRARLRGGAAKRARAGGGVRGRAQRGARGSSSHPAHERPARRHLARSLRRALRRSGRAAADLREGHPRGRADGSRSPARRSRYRLSHHGGGHRPLSDSPQGRPDALRRRRRLRRLDGRLRALTLDVALDARARCRLGAGHGERRSAPDDPAARHARRAARARQCRGDGLHQRVERARRVRIRSRGGFDRSRSGGRARRHRDGRRRRRLVEAVPVARPRRPAGRAQAGRRDAG